MREEENHKFFLRKIPTFTPSSSPEITMLNFLSVVISLLRIFFMIAISVSTPKSTRRYKKKISFSLESKNVFLQYVLTPQDIKLSHPSPLFPFQKISLRISQLPINPISKFYNNSFYNYIILHLNLRDYIILHLNLREIP